MAVYLGTNMVNVRGGGNGGSSPTLQTKTKSYTPSETAQSETVVADAGYDGLEEVNVSVGAISSTYVGSGITQRSSSDLTASGATVSVPSGYYSSNASKSVSSGTAGTPTATKGAVSNNSVSITPSVTNSTGYITGGTKTGTAVTVSASELVSGTLYCDEDGSWNVTNAETFVVDAGTVNNPTATKGTVTNHSVTVTPSVSHTQGWISSGTKTGTAVTVSASELVSGNKSIVAAGNSIDVTDYATVSVASGSATAPSTISGTSATISTGTNTLTLTKTVSVTPTVSAGYVSSGTAGNSSVSLTANVTTKAAATITPTTSNQTIAAGTYLTGAQTIAGDSNLVASNIKKNVPIFGVTGTYEGSGGGGDSGMTVATATKTLSTAAASISFTGLEGEPTSFVVTSEADLATGASPYKTAAVVFDGTNLHGQTITNTNNAQVSYDGTNFSISYSSGTLTITGSTYFQANTYKLVYTYGGTSSNIDTADVQVGSGATSITFTGLTAEPDYFSCIFKSNFSTSSGYQRTIAVVYDGTSVYGLEMDSGAHYSNAHWSFTYNNGSLTITSQGTNNGGYFHQPGYYQLTYGVGGTVAPVEIEVEPLSITQNGTYTAPSGKAYSPVTVAVSGGGGANIDTKSTTNSSNQNTSISFSSMKGEPKAFFVRCTSTLSRSSSNTYYYVADMVYDGDTTKGNMHARSNGQYSNITSGYSWSYSGTTLTLTSSGARNTSPGSFYNGTYELVYIY